jgi:hypothetical protein
MHGTLPIEADLLLAEPPAAPFDWVREGTSYWLFDESGAFGMPRFGLEAEPHSWNQRRFQSNFAFADGRVLRSAGIGAAPVISTDAARRTMSGGPLTFRCIEPFKRWHLKFDGSVIDTHVSQQIALTVDATRVIPLRYELELEMVGPPHEQNISPDFFFALSKGQQRDAASIGLGWRFEQMLRGSGELFIDGMRRDINVVGSRIKRRSVRTDGLFLRGHCWQAVLFPDGRAAGYEARPKHDDGNEPWNRGFVYQGGKMYTARATKIPWLTQLTARGDDVGFELEYDGGVVSIRGETELSTFQLSRNHLWGIALSQSGARYRWDDVTAYGMVERSSTSVLNHRD